MNYKFIHLLYVPTMACNMAFICELLKENGFMFDGAKDLKDNGYYGKNMDFIYVNYKEEN